MRCLFSVWFCVSLFFFTLATALSVRLTTAVSITLNMFVPFARPRVRALVLLADGAGSLPKDEWPYTRMSASGPHGYGDYSLRAVARKAFTSECPVNLAARPRWRRRRSSAWTSSPRRRALPRRLRRQAPRSAHVG